MAWEAATAPAASAGIRVVTFRTGIVLSGHGGALPKLLPLFKVGLGGRIGNGQQWMSWISLCDEVAAIEYLLDNPVSAAVNLVTPNPVTNRGVREHTWLRAPAAVRTSGAEIRATPATRS